MKFKKITAVAMSGILVIGLFAVSYFIKHGRTTSSVKNDFSNYIATAADIQEKTVSTIKGDINGDGKIDVFDACRVRRGIISGFKNTDYENAADVDSSGITDYDDLIQIQGFLVKKIMEFTKKSVPKSDSLVVYYSYSGNTERISLRLAELTNSDTYEIETVQTYPDDPYETALVSQKERNSGNLPELKGTPDIANYDTIYIAGPIWNGYMSTPLEKYLEITDFSEKKIAPLSTSMGSGQTGYLNDFKKRAQNPAEIAEYLDIQFPGNGQPEAFTNEQIDEKLQSWLEKINPVPEYDGLYPQHEPMGTGIGINPGRVVWAYEPDCVNWKEGVWSRTENFDYDIILSMIRNGITELAGKENCKEAWNALFTYHNNGTGYISGEKIAIKANMNGAGWGGDNTENTTNVFTNPVALRALLVSMIEDGGIPADCITVYDASRNIPQFMSDYCGQGIAKGVNFAGREECEKDKNALIKWCGPVSGEDSYLPTCVTEAKYIINFADLKGHSMNGITLTAKNHFGSFINRKSDRDAANAGLHPFVSADAMGVYTPLVDLMCHYQLGGKTFLYMLDGIIVSPGEGSTTSINSDNTKWYSKPFNGGYTASLFFSQDPVAIDSVGADFLGNEPTMQKYNSVIHNNPKVENYLHEAGNVVNAPSGTVYHNGSNEKITNLGVHEHWNDCDDKKYSRNLGKSEGIELLKTDSKMEEENLNVQKWAVLSLNDKKYDIVFSDTPTSKDVYNMLPLSLTLTPYSDLEYSGKLPKTPIYEGSPITNSAKSGTINL